MPVQIYPQQPVSRLQDTVLPKLEVANFVNPTVLSLLQIATFGWNASCTPKQTGKKKNSTYAAISHPSLMEHVAHAKANADQYIINLVDGQLPVWLRKPKFFHDAAVVIQDMERIVGTFNYYKAILEKDVALANAWGSECQTLLDYAQASITPAGIRTAAEEVLIPILTSAASDVSKQIEENKQSVTCLI